MSTILGTDGFDLLFGDRDANSIDGAGGDDVIVARGGDDVIDGGGGNDFIRAGFGDDLVRGGTGNDQINAGAGNDRINAGSGDDTIVGGLGDDNIGGGLGDDRINGGEGDDIMTGGQGADTFVFSAVDVGDSDRIRDFEIGVDVLELGADLEIVAITENRRGDAVIELSSGSFITMDNVTAAEASNEFAPTPILVDDFPF